MVIFKKMKIIIEHIDSCLGETINVDGSELHEEDFESQNALLEIMFDYLKLNNLTYKIIKDIVEHYGIIDELSQNSCDQCGHWNSKTTLEI